MKGKAMKKFGLRAFGLALMAALGLMAFTAVAAQAETLTDGGKAALFVTLGSATPVGETFNAKLENLTATFGGKTEARLHGLLLVKNLSLTILCSGFTLSGAKYLSDTEALAGIKFTGCKAFNLAGTEELTSCIVTSKETGGEKEVIVGTGIALPKKHEGVSYVQFEPDGGTTFATIFFELGKGCGLTTTNPIKGTFDAQLAKAQARPSLLSSNLAIQELMFGSVKLLYGAQPAVIDGNVNVELLGAGALCEFGVI